MKLGLWSLFATRRRFWGGMELYRLREFMRDSRQKKTKAAMKRVINCKKTWLPHFWKTNKSGFCKAWGTLLIQSYLATLTQWEVFVCYWYCGIFANLQNYLQHWTQLDSILLTGIFSHKHEVNIRGIFMYAPTFLPALLLCLFMTARGLFPLALASVNCSENLLPNLMLLLQPDQVQPLFVTPLCERSQSQLSVFPALHEAVTAWATPAAVMACRYADSRLAERAINKDNYLNWNKWENCQQ